MEHVLGVLVVLASIAAGYFGWRLPDHFPLSIVRMTLAVAASASALNFFGLLFGVEGQ